MTLTVDGKYHRFYQICGMPKDVIVPDSFYKQFMFMITGRRM